MDVYVLAVLFVANYMACAEDGTLEIVPPQNHGLRDGESETEARERLQAEMAVYEAQLLAGGWRKLCA